MRNFKLTLRPLCLRGERRDLATKSLRHKGSQEMQTFILLIMKNPFSLFLIFVLLIVFSPDGLAQNPDPNTMTKEERDAYFAKLREVSNADHKRMMDLLGIDSIRERSKWK